MISTDGGITAHLYPLDASLFNCFDPIDEDDSEACSANRKPEKAKKSESTLFDVTGYGSDTFEEPEATRQKNKRTVAKKTASNKIEPLEEYTTGERRIEFLTRIYEPSNFDKDPRAQWMTKAVNDNQKRKHTFPALDEARNNTLMVGRTRADTLLQNESAFDILLEVKDLIEAATPKTAWLQHDAHGETDEHSIEDNANPGYGADVKHDYGPSVKKVKRLWEHCNDNETSKDGKPWKVGTVELMDVVSKPSNKIVKALHHVGGLQMNECNNVTHFQDKKGEYLKFKTKTRAAKGPSLHPKVVPDPIDIHDYNGAALPRSKKGELTVGFFGGKTGASNSVMPDTLDFEPTAGPSHSSNDPWAAQLAADHVRDEAAIKLSQYRFLVGDKPYDALFQAASGFRIGELCGGRLGNTTESARGRNLLQVAIERITEERSRTSPRPKRAA